MARRAMLGAAMPEAAIDKHGDLRSRKHEVGGPPQPIERSTVEPVAESQRIDGTADG